jgi:hypothetical protein
VLNEVSQIVLKIDFVRAIGSTRFQFSLKITPDSRFVLLGLIFLVGMLDGRRADLRPSCA